MEFIIGELVKPIIRRIGTALSGTLVGVGIAAETANQIEIGFVAATLVLCDLVLSYRERKK